MPITYATSHVDGRLDCFSLLIGILESMPDTLMFLYRDEDEDSPEVNIAKHRNGPTGPAQVRYCKEITKFEDV
jgi:replicative DNA helicase